MSKILDIKRTKITFGAHDPDETQDEENRRICLQVSALAAVWRVKANHHPGCAVSLQDVVDELYRAMEIPQEE
ncbi:MAG: hypothetical protein J6I64_06820 [Lachnospiraceae bacterium]|nr:hypothetical protein [Lachnospiraceae bacterium]